jgi:hypothetical protein
VHAAALGSEAYVPGAQGTQRASAAAQSEPAEHATQEDAPELEKEFAGHCTQNFAAAELNVLFGHVKQSELDQKRPAAHAQAASPEPDVEPWGHVAHELLEAAPANVPGLQL